MRHVALTNFSLYSNRRNVDVPVRPTGVFCLAGANGLGKSSFLSAVNMGLTGIVASPRRNFLDVYQYYRESVEYSRTYFDGRIDELDHSTAQIELTFTLGSATYKISRGLFEPLALRLAHVTTSSGEVLLSGGNGEPDSDLHLAYTERIAHDCNTGSFQHFVFMQHFMLTFDERRHLLFWDEDGTEPALYLAFGLDPEDAVSATDLRSRMRKAESDARNAQWQSTQARNRMRSLGLEPSDQGALGNLVEEHQRLTRELDEASERADAARHAADDAKLQQAEISSRQSVTRARYDEAFIKRRGRLHNPSLHPIIQKLLNELACDVCGTEGQGVRDAVSEALVRSRCPVCGSPLDRHDEADTSTDVLRDLDLALAEVGERLKAASAKALRLEGEFSAAVAARTAAAGALAQFEQTHARRLPGVNTASGSLIEQSAQLLAEMQSAQRRRDQFRTQRDAYRDRLKPIQDRLSAAYREAELQFVPAFRSLAQRFIGLDLDVFLEPREATAFRLSLEVQGVRRRATTELSESQRFFLDIALRMALAEHMVPQDESAALLIDTPEGSLDIAYEARAGDMFADFVERGNQIIMTANINASQLLRRLARRCGAEKMELVRMTEWAPLSEVQASEENLFNDAYADIEADLNGDRLN